MAVTKVPSRWYYSCEIKVLETGEVYWAVANNSQACYYARSQRPV